MEKVIVHSSSKSDAYIATVLLFNNIKQMALHKIGGWVLEHSFTDVENEHYITGYTNGKMSIRAESEGCNHTYEFWGL